MLLLLLYPLLRAPLRAYVLEPQVGVVFHRPLPHCTGSNAVAMSAATPPFGITLLVLVSHAAGHCEPTCTNPGAEQRPCAAFPGTSSRVACRGCLPSRNGCHPGRRDYPRPLKLGCGVLTYRDARDKDSMCLHFIHSSAHLGPLTLVNSSAESTVGTPLPPTIMPQHDGYWAVRDGVMWATHSIGAAIQPYTFHAWYRAESLSNHTVAVHVHVSVSLRSSGGDRPVGEHEVAVRLYSESDAAVRAVQPLAEWTACFLEGTIVLSDAPTDGRLPALDPEPWTLSPGP